MTEATSGRAGPEGPPPAVLERFAAGRVARLATLSAAGPRLVPVTFAWHEGTAVWAGTGSSPSGPARCGASATWPPTRGWRCWSTTTPRTGRRCGGAAFLEGRAAEIALHALAARYPPYRDARPPGPVVAVHPRRWAWWSAA